MMTAERIKDILTSGKHEVYGIMRTSSAATAKKWQATSPKMTLIVNGDDGRFWVCRSGLAVMLTKMGYEYACI
jgi:hypothetical protein